MLVIIVESDVLLIYNVCLDSALERESNWKRKKSSTVNSERVYSQVQQADVTFPKLKDKIKDYFMKERSESWLSHVQSLSVQGEFFKLDALQEKSVEWKSIIYNLPHKVARFLMNSLTHTLNTNANLVRWGNVTSAKCNKCNNRETVHHVLN